MFPKECGNPPFVSPGNITKRLRWMLSDSWLMREGLGVEWVGVDGEERGCCKGMVVFAALTSSRVSVMFTLATETNERQQENIETVKIGGRARPGGTGTSTPCLSRHRSHTSAHHPRDNTRIPFTCLYHTQLSANLADPPCPPSLPPSSANSFHPSCLYHLHPDCNLLLHPTP
jgi:hypothetical protein